MSIFDEFAASDFGEDEDEGEEPVTFNLQSWGKSSKLYVPGPFGGRNRKPHSSSANREKRCRERMRRLRLGVYPAITFRQTLLFGHHPTLGSSGNVNRPTPRALIWNHSRDRSWSFTRFSILHGDGVADATLCDVKFRPGFSELLAPIPAEALSFAPGFARHLDAGENLQMVFDINPEKVFVVGVEILYSLEARQPKKVRNRQQRLRRAKRYIRSSHF
jgi:hypothetical protein